MFSLMPHFSEVLVSSITCEEVMFRLQSITRNVDYLSTYDRDIKENSRFNGVLKKNSFRISLVISKADSFLPLIKGKIEPTPTGCIIFLDFSLFPGAGFFLGFWSLITFLMALFFLLAVGDPWFALVSFLVGLGNWAFTWNHFKRKVKHSRTILHQILSLQKND